MFRWFNRKDTPSTPPLGAVTRDLRGDEWHIELDLTPQVLKLSIPEDTGWQESDELAPTLRDLMRRGFKESRFISASMLALKAKLFDDGLYAAAEVAMQPAKATLLTRLLNSTPVIDAAARLGGMDIPNSPDVDRITQEFLDNDLESKPIGFYTWNDELRRIFQQDRLLGRRLESRDIAALTGALDADPSAKAAYLSHLSTVSRLTNPADAATPGLFSSGGACFFPPSRSYESDLIQRVYGERPIPDGFSLAQEIVNRVRDGSLNFDPAEKSGWYDFQTWALEPLIVPERMPEAARLRTNDRYRQQLEELFKAVLSLTRETHVKVVKIPMVGAAMPFWQEQRVAVDVEPELTVEPLRTYYERRAKTYEFVRSILECIGPLHSMRAVSASGPSPRTLDEDLADVTATFRGAAAVAAHELGMEPETGPQAARFRDWARKPDDFGDIRMMVPIFYDVGRARTKVWAILGWAMRPLFISFVTPPKAHIRRGSPRIDWVPAYKDIPYPVFAETYVSRLLDRDEYRAHCDRYKTAERILAHL